MESLSQFNIPRNTLPVEIGGELRFSIDEWIKERANKETKRFPSIDIGTACRSDQCISPNKKEAVPINSASTVDRSLTDGGKENSELDHCNENTQKADSDAKHENSEEAMPNPETCQITPVVTVKSEMVASSCAPLPQRKGEVPKRQCCEEQLNTKRPDEGGKTSTKLPDKKKLKREESLSNNSLELGEKAGDRKTCVKKIESVFSTSDEIARSGEQNDDIGDTTGNKGKLKHPGRSGDNRMNKSVEARLSDPHMPLLDALLKGGFSFPLLHQRGISNRSVRDTENVTLIQRKNQLSRRLRAVVKKPIEE